jgi:putative ABC transport system permease protein
LSPLPEEGGVLNDFRFALRSLHKSPGFTAVAVLTLALGIGANTTIFSLVYAVLLRPLPYRDAGRVMVLNETTPKVGTVSVSYPNFLDWRSESRRFSQMAFVHSVDLALEGVERPQLLSGDAVSPDFLSLLGVRPELGRDFAASEEDPGADPVAILSYGLWRARFGGDRGVLGRTITLDGHALAVVGVLPQGFRTLDDADLLLPIGVWRAVDPDGAGQRGSRGNSVVVARLAPGSDLRDARVEMQGIAGRLARAYPAANDQFGVRLDPVRDFLVGDVRPTLVVLFAAVMFVLLIACANVANLLLSRGAARAREIALRTALGASRARLASQMMSESLVLACFGGLAGLLVALAGMRAVAALVPAEQLGDAAIALNGPVLLFTGGVIVLVACLFGTVPALRFTRPDVQTEIKEGGRTVSDGARSGRLRTLHAGSTIALALILLTGAGLMMKTMARLSSVDAGVRTDRVLTVGLALRGQRYAEDAAALTFWRQLLDRVRALPGGQEAALGTVVPFTNDHSRADITIESMPLPAPGSFPHPDYHIVSPGYLGTVGITLLTGRGFTERDDERAPRVGIVNQTLARQYFPGQNPIGKRFMFGHPSATEAPQWITIVGEVADTKLYGLASPPRLEVYVPYPQRPPSEVTLLVKSEVQPAAMTSAIRDVVASIDPDQPISAVATLDQLRAQSVGDRRTALILLAAFSGLAVLLAGIGIYGVISYAAARRTHEIGIRMALGARQRGVLLMVLTQGGRIAIVAVAVGVAAAIALTRMMSGLLYGVSPSDPLTFLAAAVVLVLVALVASYVPARRAARVDPMEALRYE